MYCPDCGHDAGDAKFCPECGAGLADVGGGRRASAAPATTAKPRLSPALLWGVIAVAVAVAIVVVVIVAGGGSSSGSTSTGGEPQLGAPDKTGSYAELVDRANRLYDLGQEQFAARDYQQGAAYFRDASRVYAAAWDKQPGNPSVGTDYAVALFYGGDLEASLRQIAFVLETHPGFQNGWLNKAIFLSHQARISEQAGSAGDAARLYDRARAAFRKAIAIDPASAAGLQAKSAMKELLP